MPERLDQMSQHAAGNAAPAVIGMHYHIFNIGVKLPITDGTHKANQFIARPGPNGNILTQNLRNGLWLAIRPPVDLVIQGAYLAGINLSFRMEQNTPDMGIFWRSVNGHRQLA